MHKGSLYCEKQNTILNQYQIKSGFYYIIFGSMHK